MQFAPDDDTLSSSSSDYDGKPEKKVVIPDDAPWKNKEYHRLPPNVQHAIDLAEIKKKHSAFFYKLETLNDKIFVFRELYYSKMPQHQRNFLEKKRQKLEEQLALEKKESEAKMNKMSKRLRKR